MLCCELDSFFLGGSVSCKQTMGPFINEAIRPSLQLWNESNLKLWSPLINGLSLKCCRPLKTLHLVTLKLPNTGWNSKLCRLSFSWISTARFKIWIWKLVQIILWSYPMTWLKHETLTQLQSQKWKIAFFSIKLKNCHIFYVIESKDFYFS